MAVTIRKKKTEARGESEAPGAPRRNSRGTLVTTRVDDKGRVTLPAQLRAALGIAPGTMFAVRSEGDGFFFTRVENPFDALATEAMEERRAGRTRNLRDFARERNIAVDDP